MAPYGLSTVVVAVSLTPLMTWGESGSKALAKVAAVSEVTARAAAITRVPRKVYWSPILGDITLVCDHNQKVG